MESSKNWQHYLTRPFSLFGTSLWYVWYADYAQRLATKDISDMISVEESVGVVRNYRRKENLEHLTRCLGEMAVQEKARAVALLDKADEYNIEAGRYLNGEIKFTSISEGVDFFFELALHATIVPHFLVEGLSLLGAKDQEIVDKSIALRGVSLYPKFLKSVLMPLVEAELVKHGVTETTTAAELITLQELLAGDVSKINNRRKEREQNKKYIYKVEDRMISLTWHDNTESHIQELEGGVVNTEIKGNIAYPGKVRGVVRIVKTLDVRDQEFNEGDILVSINSNPNLMNLILKAGAIVTDEGGLTCHAVIVSRELKKPCIVGTKNATKILKEGDIIEVDANTGIVKKVS